MNKLTPDQIQALADAQNLIARVQRQIEMTLPAERTVETFNKCSRDQIYDSQRVYRLAEAYTTLNLILCGDSL